MIYYNHIPIMVNEVIENLVIDNNGIYLDCTFGSGGHSAYILSKLLNGKLISIDRDSDCIHIANKINDSRFTFYNALFSEIGVIIKNNNLLNKIDGILIDLGVSNNQIKNPNRGFSFMNDGPIDMRMGLNKNSAYELLNKLNYRDICFILKNFGEEKLYKKISKKIIDDIKNNKFINSTLYLSNLICGIKKYKYKRKKHPSTNTFRALRIYTNNELKELSILLNNINDILSNKGRLLIITFNSIESKIVKEILLQNNFFKNIKKIKPTKSEIYSNYSSRSAVLRIFNKII